MKVTDLPAAGPPSVGTLRGRGERPLGSRSGALSGETYRHDIARIGDQIEHLMLLVPGGMLEGGVVLGIEDFVGTLDAAIGRLVEGDGHDGAVGTERGEAIGRLRENETAARDGNGAYRLVGLQV